MFLVIGVGIADVFLVIGVGIADGLKVINVGTVDIFKMVDAVFVVVRSVNLSNFCSTFMLSRKFSCFGISSENKNSKFYVCVK